MEGRNNFQPGRFGSERTGNATPNVAERAVEKTAEVVTKEVSKVDKVKSCLTSKTAKTVGVTLLSAAGAYLGYKGVKWLYNKCTKKKQAPEPAEETKADKK